MVVGSARRLTAADIRARWAQNISCGQGSALRSAELTRQGRLFEKVSLHPVKTFAL